ncbi:MAG: ATP-binding protein [Anaerolineae bacterium]
MNTAAVIPGNASPVLTVQEIEQRLRRVTLFAARLQLFFSSALVWLIFIFSALPGGVPPLLPTLALILWLVGVTLGLSFIALRSHPDFLTGPAAGRIALATTIVTALLATFLARDSHSDFYLVYFFPVVVASVYYGLRGGLATATLGTLSYIFLAVVLNGVFPGQLLATPLLGRILYLFALAGALGVGAEGQLALIKELRRAYQELCNTTQELETTRTALARRVEEAESLALVAREFTSTFDTEQVLRIVLEQIQSIMRTEAATLMLVDEQTNELVFQIPIGSKRPELQGYRLTIGQGVAGIAAQTGQPVRVDNTTQDGRHFKEVDQQSGFQTRSILCVPMKNKERVIGVIEVLNKAEGPFTDDDVKLLGEFSQWAAIALENAHLYQDLQHSMTDLQKVHEQMLRAEPLRALGQMAGGIAHDFNNLLTIILAEAQVLRSSPHDTRDLASFQRIEQAARDASDTVRRIQEYTRKRRDTPRQTIHIDHLIREAVEITRPRWQPVAQLTLQLQSQGQVLGDAVELREVMTNLIFNAVDASVPDCPCKITITTRRIDHLWVLVTVEDNGTGIPPDVQARIFDPYFTTKPEGTGLGLSMARNIITGHGGDIRVTSPVLLDDSGGSGTRFGIRLPLVIDEPAHTDGGKTAMTRLILLVDDDPNILLATSKLLALGGYQVETARTTAEVDRQLPRADFDLIMTDLSMPEQTGWEIAKRSKELYPNRPVFMVTAWGDSLSMDGERKGLVDGVLTKPFTSRDLDNLLNKLKQSGKK